MVTWKELARSKRIAVGGGLNRGGVEDSARSPASSNLRTGCLQIR